jgi:hypothetical protein
MASPTSSWSFSDSMGRAKPKTVAAQLARLRVEAVWRCISILDPDLKGEAKLEMARKMLTLVDGKDRTQPPPPAIRITAAQVEGIIWANIQCINPRCPMLLFSKQIADELNEFFMPEE